MNELTSAKQMSIYEVALSMEVAPKTITKYVNKVFPEKIKNGVQTLLSEVEVTAVKLKMEQNQHLDRSVKLPKTALEKKLLIHQAFGFLNEEIEELKQKVEYQAEKLEAVKPQVEFANMVEESVNSISVAEFANLLSKKGLKTGQNKLFKYFYDAKYLINSSRPYQHFLNIEIFEVKKVVYDDRTTHKVLITGKGQVYLTGRILKYSQSTGSQEYFKS